jgi:hypothetical protein
MNNIEEAWKTEHFHDEASQRFFALIFCGRDYAWSNQARQRLE